MIRRFSLLLLTALLFAACDSDEPEDFPPLNAGEFRARITFDGHDDALDLSGIASASTFPIFVIDSVFVPGDSLAVPDSSTLFAITLSDIDPDRPQPDQVFRSISLMRFDGEPPGIGTYPISESDIDRFGFRALFSSFASSGGGTFLIANTGTLVIDVSTEERMAGGFNFRGSYASLGSGQPRTATVTGTFDALFFEPDDVPSVPAVPPAVALRP